MFNLQYKCLIQNINVFIPQSSPFTLNIEDILAGNTKVIHKNVS